MRRSRALAKLKPAFPGDAPKDMRPGDLVGDGGQRLVAQRRRRRRWSWRPRRTPGQHGLPIMARITAYATGAVAPQDLFFAPVTAVRNLMRKEGRTIGDYDLIEANEAFASQALADGAELGWDWDRVNVHGGAIALGHPDRRQRRAGAHDAVVRACATATRATGLATLCLGGGDAVALSVERV